jgi:hypothetical protein
MIAVWSSTNDFQEKIDFGGGQYDLLAHGCLVNQDDLCPET